MGEAYLIQGGIGSIIQALSPKSESIEVSGSSSWYYGINVSVSDPTPTFPWKTMYLKVTKTKSERYAVYVETGSCSRGGKCTLAIPSRDGTDYYDFTLSSDGTSVSGRIVESSGGSTNTGLDTFTLEFTGKS